MGRGDGQASRVSLDELLFDRSPPARLSVKTAELADGSRRTVCFSEDHLPSDNGDTPALVIEGKEFRCVVHALDGIVHYDDGPAIEIWDSKDGKSEQHGRVWARNGEFDLEKLFNVAMMTLEGINDRFSSRTGSLSISGNETSDAIRSLLSQGVFTTRKAPSTYSPSDGACDTSIVTWQDEQKKKGAPIAATIDTDGRLRTLQFSTILSTAWKSGEAGEAPAPYSIQFEYPDDDAPTAYTMRLCWRDKRYTEYASMLIDEHGNPTTEPARLSIELIDLDTDRRAIKYANTFFELPRPNDYTFDALFPDGIDL